MTRAFEKAEDRREELIAAMAMPVGTEEEKEAKIQTVKAIYDDLNIGEEAKAEITRLHSRAMEHAAGLGPKPEAYALLENYAKKLIGRTK